MRMTYSRRSILAGALAAPLAACMGDDRRSGPTRLYVLGTIHSNHTRSKAYSLDVLAEAFRRAEPDLLLAEIPPDRIAEAYRSFRYDGKVTEPRSEEHTSELQSLMRIPYAVSCFKKK